MVDLFGQVEGATDVTVDDELERCGRIDVLAEHPAPRAVRQEQRIVLEFQGAVAGVVVDVDGGFVEPVGDGRHRGRQVVDREHLVRDLGCRGGDGTAGGRGERGDDGYPHESPPTRELANR